MAFHNGRITIITVVLLVWAIAIKNVRADNEVAVIKSLSEKYPDFSPHAIIDVGANKGGWTQKVAADYYPNAKYLLFEATPERENEIKLAIANVTHAEYRIEVLGERGRQGQVLSGRRYWQFHL